MGPHVDLLVSVHTGQDEEDSRPPSSSYQQPAQPEDDGPLVLLEEEISTQSWQCWSGGDKE